MRAGADCEEARSHFPDLLGGPADPAARAHVDACRRCAEELAGLAAVLQDAEGIGAGDVPDPGPEYWDGFLPAVRARIAARDPAGASGRRLWGPAAAAALLVAAGLAALLRAGSGPAVDGEARLTRVLEALSSMPQDEAQVIAGLDPDPFTPAPAAAEPREVGAAEILEAMQELLPPPGDVPWVDEEIRWLVEDLDESEAARLVVELKRDRG